MYTRSLLTCLLALVGPPLLSYGQTTASQPLSDPGVGGVMPEIVHLYYDEWPTGIAVSRSGRKFSNYPPALDPDNRDYTIAELISNNTERPYPSAEFNSPPGGRINYTTTPPTGANYQKYLIGSQSVVVDPADRLWILDTGRVALPNGSILEASYGGPKLIGINLTNDQIFKNIVFDPSAAPSDSYLNDVRIDLNPELSASGQGIAYITDSSPEGRNALVVVDLGSGEAWRRLVNIPAVTASEGFVPFVFGEPVYQNFGPSNSMPIGNINFGADGIAISPDGKTLYFGTTGGRNLYSVPTERLRDRTPYAELRARGAVQFLTEKGLTDGMETDSNGVIYGGSIEANALFAYNTTTNTVSTFSRDPRYTWTDTLAVAEDGYIYYTENQLIRSPGYNGGVDMRVKPYVLFRAKLPNGGTKITQAAPKNATNSTMSR